MNFRSDQQKKNLYCLGLWKKSKNCVGGKSLARIIGKKDQKNHNLRQKANYLKEGRKEKKGDRNITDKGGKERAFPTSTEARRRQQRGKKWAAMVIARRGKGRACE